MPFKSRAQQRYMFAAEDRGELPRGTARRWARHTKSIKKLPLRADDQDSDEEEKVATLVANWADRWVRRVASVRPFDKMANRYERVRPDGCPQGGGSMLASDRRDSRTGSPVSQLLSTVGLAAQLGLRHPLAVKLSHLVLKYGPADPPGWALRLVKEGSR